MPEEGSYKATITLPSDRELVITRGAAETYDRHATNHRVGAPPRG
jgi:hypothetical protein